MSNIKEVIVHDDLASKATKGDVYERKIKLHWDDREQPELINPFDCDAGKKRPRHAWKRKDTGEYEQWPDALLEAENNGLNPGLREKRDRYRETLRLILSERGVSESHYAAYGCEEQETQND